MRYLEVLFVAPPLLFLSLHVLLHMISQARRGSSIWHAANAGIHFAVAAASVQGSATLYYAKFLSTVPPDGAHVATVARAMPPAVLLLVGALLTGIIIALVDGWLRARHEHHRTNGSSQRKVAISAAALLLIPNVLGFLVFGFVAARIIAVGLMPDAH